jgi:hypothetical protein
MSIVLEIHLAVGFLVALCALIFTWNSMGRRVMNAVLGLQVLIGFVVAGMLGAALSALGSAVWLHIVCAILALLAYGFSRRIGDRPGGAGRGLALAIAGFVLVFVTIYLGWHLAGRV